MFMFHSKTLLHVASIHSLLTNLITLSNNESGKLEKHLKGIASFPEFFCWNELAFPGKWLTHNVPVKRQKLPVAACKAILLTREGSSSSALKVRST